MPRWSMSVPDHNNESRPAVNGPSLWEQMRKLLAHERTFPPGARAVYENGVEKKAEDRG